MVRSLILLLCVIFCASLVYAGETIDEEIEKSEKSKSAVELHQADGSILSELDMHFTQEQWEEMQELLKNNGTGKRNALRSLQRRWTNAEVPYHYADSFTTSEKQRIEGGINQWNTYSCVNIRQKTSSDNYYVSIVDGGGCSSYVGMSQRGQRLTLARGCRISGIVAHEFGHALGFHHEQTRPDRDEYVRIHEQNITPRNRFNFKKYNWQMINAYGVPYDYESIMHYGGRAFSSNRQLTIETLDPKYQNVIGNRQGISFLDVKLINLMYDCNKKCQKKTCPGDGFVGKDCKCWCRGPSRTQPAVYCDTKRPVNGGNTNTNTNNGGSPTTGDRDNNKYCPVWAKNGECKRNPGYMLKNCVKSCKSVGAM